ncbi:hypothetical protein EGT36_21405 [Agrobacterium sp. FDAARGOS_525]|uniref:hypothetical protein n=1 Tax=Agrobacterium sp. FDAARGOS_525 TaxID=2420311 RepID=UPI000F66F81B|nr:hypothetical protein [Agrobacterium sp. FDAARGOS_525]RSC31232.1 hypothetical protein EGT36_21405 [Agrobacterium sp. FDAARGOS_525]
MTEVPTDIIDTAEKFTTAFYQGERGHSRDQFKNSVAAMIDNERKRCTSIVRLLPLGPFQTVDEAVKAAETQVLIADAVEKAGWTP